MNVPFAPPGAPAQHHHEYHDDGHLDVTRLIEQTMPLVGHLVREASYRLPAHVDRDDLVGAGLAALVRAARSYDAAHGTSFPQYATIRIRGAILDELRRTDWASRSVRRRAREHDEHRDRLTSLLGRPPNEAELAASLGVGRSEIATVQDDLHRAVIMSLEGLTDGNIDEMLSSTTPTPPAVLEYRERLAYLEDAVAVLPHRLKAVVEGYFFGDRKMADIAADLGVTESRVSQMRAEALVLLRGALESTLDAEAAQATRHTGTAARRRQAYFAEVAARRTYDDRLSRPHPSPRNARPHTA